MDNVISLKDPVIIEYFDKLETVRKRDNDEYMRLSKELYELSRDSGNVDLKSCAAAILGDAYTMFDNYFKALYYLSSCINDLVKTDEYRLISRAYNELGIIYRTQGQYVYSLENYLNAAETSREHGLNLQEAVACSNLASLCQDMGAYSESITYHERCLECSQKVEIEDFRDDLMQVEYCMLTMIYVIIGDSEMASDSFSKLQKIIDKYPGFFDRFEVSICYWFYYSNKGIKEEIEKSKKRCIEAFFACDEYVTYYSEIVDFVKMMYRDKEYEVLEKIFARIDENKVDGELINLHLIMSMYKINMYKELNDMDKMMKAGYDYFVYDSMKKEDTKKSFMTALTLKVELDKQKTTNLFLSEAAETDALTGLPNRAKLNAVIDELFVMADKEKKNLGVEMMDVDYFKHINDNYGHAKGDELLTAIGKSFKELVNEKIFVARYGGDEFVVYYYDMTDQEIMWISQKIKEKIKKIGVSLGLGELSVSQGIVNHVPEPLNRAWDYLNSADYALYYVKEHGRAGATLIHKRTDLDAGDCKIA